MKIQLDTTNKTIKLENNVKLLELIDILEKLLPDGEWKKFTLETGVVINNWSTPYIIEKIREIPTYRQYPWYWSGTSINDNIALVNGSAGTAGTVGVGTSQYSLGMQANNSVDAMHQLQAGSYNVEVLS